MFTGIYAGESQAWPDPSCRNQKVEEQQLRFIVVDQDFPLLSVAQLGWAALRPGRGH